MRKKALIVRLHPVKYNELKKLAIEKKLSMNHLVDFSISLLIVHFEKIKKIEEIKK